MSALGSDSFQTVTPSNYDATLPPVGGIFARDYMTGGNRTHNAEAAYLVGEIVRQVEEARGECGCVDPLEVRRWVHQEFAYFKDNGGGQTNANGSRADWPEIIEHGVDRFIGRDRFVTRAIETSEDMNWHIEDLIERELMRPENAALEAEMGLERMETLRATLRTRLRSEFSSILMNEWGSERLEDISDFLKLSIVSDFETRASNVIAEVTATESVCSVADSALPAANDGVYTAQAPANAAPAVGVSASLEGRELGQEEVEEFLRTRYAELGNSRYDGLVQHLADTVLRAEGNASGRIPATHLADRIDAVVDLITRRLEARSSFALAEALRAEDRERPRDRESLEREIRESMRRAAEIGSRR